MPTARLSSKSQIVVPATVREHLGIKPGDQIAIAIEGDHAVLRKVIRAPLAELYQLIDPKAYAGASAELEKARDDWDAE